MVFRFTLTIDDAVENARLHRSGVRSTLQRMPAGVLGALVLLSIIYRLNHAMSSGARLVWLCVAAFLLVLGFAPGLLMDPITRRLARKNPLLGVPTEVEVTDAGVSWRGRTRWDAEWNAFRAVKRSPSMVLLYFGPQEAITIPLRGGDAAMAAQLDAAIAAHPFPRKRDAVPVAAPAISDQFPVDAVVVRYTLVQPDWSAAMKRALPAMKWFRIIRIGFPVFAAVSFSGFALHVFQGREENSAANWGGVLVFLLLAAAFPRWIPGIIGRSAFRQNWLRGETVVGFSDSGVRALNAYGNAHFPWSTFSAWSEDVQVIAVLLGAQVLVVPTRALDAEAGQRIRALLHRKLGKPDGR